jgi:hypothetical protein
MKQDTEEPMPDGWKMPDGSGPWAVVMYDREGPEHRTPIRQLFTVDHRYQAVQLADGINALMPESHEEYAGVDLREGAELYTRDPPATMTEPGPW